MKNKIFMLVVLTTLFLSACTKKQIHTKSFDEIYKEKGIPVTVEELKEKPFAIYLTYNGTLTGYKQSFASAMVGGRIEKINVKIGDYVKKDSVIIEFPLDAPSAQYAQAKAAYELAKKTFLRMKNLYNAGGISKQKLDQIETQFEVSKANWNTVQQLLKVRAPISGYVTAINVNVTDNVKQRTILATISQTNKLKARIWATEDEIMQIKKGMPATAIWKNITLKGRVTETDQAMNPKHNAFGVNLIFDNPNNKVKSGIVADIKIMIYHKNNALTIPSRIIKSDEKGKFVYLAENFKATKRYITLGKNDEITEIISGLNSGDKVIIKGANMVYENAKIMITE